ncbi:MAG: hypothetical protein EHM23_20105 [Acidobacteria bacterium]|nr:MAG: hypothetical protein EHM23_20105 [Acidobacteriota bacterium]
MRSRTLPVLFLFLFAGVATAQNQGQKANPIQELEERCRLLEAKATQLEQALSTQTGAVRTVLSVEIPKDSVGDVVITVEDQFSITQYHHYAVNTDLIKLDDPPVVQLLYRPGNRQQPGLIPESLWTTEEAYQRPLLQLKEGQALIMFKEKGISKQTGQVHTTFHFLKPDADNVIRCSVLIIR